MTNIIMSKKITLEKHLIENQFITPSYTLYGGSSGYQDYGILGCIVKNRLLEIWRKQFVKEDVYEVETPILTPYNVLKASGHVDNFTDYIIIDHKNSKEYRVDHLIKKHLENTGKDSSVVDKMNLHELEQYAKEYLERELNMKREEIKVVPKNLMFQSENMFLRPEIAQGMFVNFKRYYDFLKKIPFGIAQIGKSYRKEISPVPFTRMREFTQAEIEYFFDPNNITHKDYREYSQTTDLLPILSQYSQLNDNKIIMTTLKELVETNTVCNQIIGVYLYKIYKFAKTIGINPDKIRFRQHLKTEMAHYAGDCWDLECLVDEINWLECVGCAYRQDYDTKSHSNKSGQSMAIRRENKIKMIKPKAHVIGKIYKSNSKQIIEYILSNGKIHDRQIIINSENVFYVKVHDVDYKINCDMYDIVDEYDDFYPHVIEPSFGIDRLIYVLLEHSFWKRENDEQRIVLSLADKIAPYDFGILQLSNNDELSIHVDKLKFILTEKGYRCYIDPSSTSIGKRYCRTDKLGIKYVFTVDFDTLVDNTVTVRNRETMKQIRIGIKYLESSCSSEMIHDIDIDFFYDSML